MIQHRFLMYFQTCLGVVFIITSFCSIADAQDELRAITVKHFENDAQYQAKLVIQHPSSISIQASDLSITLHGESASKDKTHWPALRLDADKNLLTQTVLIVQGSEQTLEGAYALDYQAQGRKQVRLGTMFWRHRGQYLQYLPADKLQNHALPPEFAMWTKQDKQKQIQAACDLIVSIKQQLIDGNRLIRIPTGHYRFESSMRVEKKNDASAIFEFSDLKDVVIDGQGATFWITDRSLPLINLKDGKGVTFRNMVIDYDPLPYIQGRIVAVDRGDQPAMSLMLSPGFEDSFALLPKKGQINFHVFEDDDEHGLPRSQTWIAGHNNGQPVTYDPATRLVHVPMRLAKEALDLPDWGLHVGEMVALTPRVGGKSPIQVYNARQLTVDNVKVYASGRFGFFIWYAYEPVTFNRYVLARRPNTRRLISSNMDGIHIKFASGGPKVIDSVMEAVMDDSIAIPSMNAFTLAQFSEKQILATTRHSSFPINVAKGSKVRIYNMKLPSVIQHATVTDVQKYDPSKVKPDQRVQFKKTQQPYVITLDQPVNVQQQSMVVSDMWGGNGCVIDNCYITNGWANAIRSTGHHGVIRNCTFQHTWGLTMAIQGYWFIGTELEDVLIANNRFLDTARGRGDGRPLTISGPDTLGQTHQNIRIIGNRFEGCDHAALYLKSIKNLQLKDNVFINTNRLPNPDDEPTRRGAVIMIDCPQPLLENNRMEHTGSAVSPLIQLP
jgi:hypothetical protein